MTKKKLTLIDTSSLFYSVAYYAKKHELSLHNTLDTFSEWFEAILNETDCDMYIAFADESNTFRHKLLPEFKDDRKYSELPYKKEIKEHGINNYNIITHNDLESDDLVVLHHEYIKELYDVTMASPDGDLRQIPGKFFNYTYRRYNSDPNIIISEETANYNLFKSIVAGSHNGLKGLSKFGKQAAEKAFALNKDPLNIYINGFNKIKGLGRVQGTLEYTKNFISSYLLRTKADCNYLGINFEYSSPIIWKKKNLLDF